MFFVTERLDKLLVEAYDELFIKNHSFDLLVDDDFSECGNSSILPSLMLGSNCMSIIACMAPP